MAFTIRNLAAATCFLAIGGSGFGADETYSKVVAPFLQAHCQDCHSGKKPEADFAVSSLGGPSRFNDDVDGWKKIFKMLVTGQMPPADETQPAKQDRARVIAWIKASLTKHGHVSEWDRKLLFPEYGNYVNHDRLFDGSIKSAAFSPSRLWKKNPNIFDSMLIRGMSLGQGRNGRLNGHLGKVKQPFNLEDRAGIVDYAAIVYADSATLGTLMRNAEVFVDKFLAGAMHERYVRVHGEIPDDKLPKDKRGRPIRKRHPKTAAEFSDIVLTDNKPTDQQIDAALGRMFELTVERAPSAADLTKYRTLARKCITEGGNAEGLRIALIAVAISPRAIYRMELGQGQVDQHGRRMLSSANLAYSIAYALTDDKPDQKLLDAAKNGRLKTREDVAREVTRIWDDKSIAKPRVLRFFREYFGYHKAPGVFKDTSRFGKDYRKVPERLVEDADTLVMHIVKRDQNVLAELLTTEKYFVSHSGDNAEELEIHTALQKFYDYYKDKPWRKFPYKVPDEHMKYVRSLHKMFMHANGNVTRRLMKYLEQCDKAGISHMPLGGARSSGRDYITAYNLTDKSFSYPVKQPFVLAKGKRAGILMHPAWLIAHSHNLDNDPVRRGKWIRERLLADTVPELPITVDARIPENPHQSLRERFAVTRQQECWKCHRKMNPLGMPFELYDDFGRYRDVEKLHAPRKTKPVNSTGLLDSTGVADLDGKVADPIDMMRRLAKSDRVRQSFTRHAFRYWMGRNEMLSDSSTLIAADTAYFKNNGSFRALVISLLTSDSFLYRKPIEGSKND